MQLTIGNGQVLDQPSPDLVAGVLHALPGPKADSYVILERAECHFMQSSGWWKGGFTLEYQDGSVDEHFQCPDRRLPLASVIAAFQSYLANDDRWRTMCAWRRLKIRRSWWRRW